MSVPGPLLEPVVNEFGADSERQRTEVLIKCSHCINKSN